MTLLLTPLRPCPLVVVRISVHGHVSAPVLWADYAFTFLARNQSWISVPAYWKPNSFTVTLWMNIFEKQTSVTNGTRHLITRDMIVFKQQLLSWSIISGADLYVNSITCYKIEDHTGIIYDSKAHDHSFPQKIRKLFIYSCVSQEGKVIRQIKPV